jgi:hypothetical protein
MGDEEEVGNWKEFIRGKNGVDITILLGDFMQI